MAVSSGSWLVLDLINEALSHLGVYTGDPLSAADVQNAFTTFCLMLDGWQAQSLAVFQRGTSTFSTSANKRAYSLGVGAGFDWQVSALPADFETLTQGPAGSGLELPIEMIGNLEYDSIPLKGLSSGILSKCNISSLTNGFALSFWPAPSAAIAVNLYLVQRLAGFTAVSNSVVLPPGYAETLVLELAAKLSTKFGAALPEWLPMALADAKANIKAANWPALESVVDRALVRRESRLGGTLDFYLGR